MRNMTSEPQQGQPWEGDDLADVDRTKDGCCYTTLPLGRNEGPEDSQGGSLWRADLALKTQLFRGSLTDVEQHAAPEIQ